MSSKSNKGASRAEDIILRNLDRIPGRINRVNSAVVMIVCPFHEDGTPSCMLNITDNERFTTGFFRCLGCQAKGGWNLIAEKLGLDKIEEKDYRKTRMEERDKGELRKQMLGINEETEDDGTRSVSLDEMFCALRVGMPIPFPVEDNWRGQPGKFLAKVGAYLAFDSMDEDTVVVFPVRVNKQIVGGIKARWKKSKRKDVPSYKNSYGNWTARDGLFPYDYARKLARRKGIKWIVLVEGPRDALRLLRKGIPAVSIMGTQNWSKDKAQVIVDSGMKVLVCMDGDSAGLKARRQIRRALSPYGRVFVFPMNEIAKKLGLRKMDPGNMPIRYVREIKEIVYA